MERAGVVLYSACDPFGVACNDKPDPFFAHFLHAIGRRPPDDVLLPADGKALYKHLKRYGGVRPANLHKDPHLVTIMERVVGELYSPVHSIDILDVHVNLNASPGLHYRELGHKSRRDAFDTALADAEAALERLNAGEAVAPRFFQAFGRAKLVSRALRAVKSGRMIQAMDTRDFLLTARHSQPFLKKESQQYSPNRLLSTAIGYSHFNGGYHEFHELYSLCKFIIALDLKGYDATIPWEIIELVLLMLRPYLPDMTQAEFDFLRSTILSRAVAMPDGKVYLLLQGLASGHSWTQLLENIITLSLILRACLIALGDSVPDPASWIFENVAIRDLGDDGYVGFLVAPPFTFADFAAAFNSFCCELSADKCTSVYCGVDRGPADASFLGKLGVCIAGRWLPHRPAEESISLLLNSEREVTEPWYSYVRATGLLLDNFFDDEWRLIAKGYTRHLEIEYGVDPESLEWTKDMLNFVFFQYLSDPSSDTPIPVSHVHDDVQVIQLYL